jgi:hypothetical protein
MRVRHAIELRRIIGWLTIFLGAMDLIFQVMALSFNVQNGIELAIDAAALLANCILRGRARGWTFIVLVVAIIWNFGGALNEASRWLLLGSGYGSIPTAPVFLLRLAAYTVSATYVLWPKTVKRIQNPTPLSLHSDEGNWQQFIGIPQSAVCETHARSFCRYGRILCSLRHRVHGVEILATQ